MTFIKDLAEHLDTLPQRFATNTGTGLELKVLQHVFSPEEAEMAIHLKPMPESGSYIAARNQNHGRITLKEEWIS